MDNNQRIMAKTIEGVNEMLELDVKHLFIRDEDYDLLIQNIEMKILSAFGEYGVGSPVSKPKKSK